MGRLFRSNYTYIYIYMCVSKTKTKKEEGEEKKVGEIGGRRARKGGREGIKGNTCQEGSCHDDDPSRVYLVRLQLPCTIAANCLSLPPNPYTSATLVVASTRKPERVSRSSAST